MGSSPGVSAFYKIMDQEIVLYNFTDHGKGENLQIKFLRNHFSLNKGKIIFIIDGKIYLWYSIP